ncbi:hypothetical protein PMIT1323_01945 [Prochlorococcus marinus str. MIT 1323]|nr:hypothetical protein PMIT1323_01945 [Prochlorococcus marinus str. MIT 1323]
MKKGTRVGCPQVQDRFLEFLRPRTPDLGLSKQKQGVSRKNCCFRSSVSKYPSTTLSHHSGAGSHKHFYAAKNTKKDPESRWGGEVGVSFESGFSQPAVSLETNPNPASPGASGHSLLAANSLSGLASGRAGCNSPICFSSSSTTESWSSLRASRRATCSAF